MKFTKVRNVTRPVLKLATKTAYYLRFDGAMALGKIVDDKKEPPMLADVTNMETGEEGMMILGAVLRDNLNEAYPGDAYVGKIFEIVKTAPEGARKYALWSVAEVSAQADDAAPADSKPAKAKKGE